MNFQGKIVVAISMILLSGCAASYKANGFTGGFSEVRLAENIYRVSAKGNAYTSPERAYNIAMLRSAELTLQSGHRYFVFADSSSAISTQRVYNPQTSTTNFNANVTGNMVTGQATTTTYGGGYTTFQKPSTDNVVVMYKEKPEWAQFYYDARFVCESLAPQFKVTCP